jgi:hypothetical protein
MAMFSSQEAPTVLEPNTAYSQIFFCPIFAPFSLDKVGERHGKSRRHEIESACSESRVNAGFKTYPQLSMTLYELSKISVDNSVQNWPASRFSCGLALEPAEMGQIG